MRDFWNESSKKEKKLNVKKVRRTIIIVIVFIIITGIITVYVASQNARNWIDKNILRKEIMQENVINIDIEPDQNIKAYAFNKNIVTLNNNVLKIYNNSGKKEKDLNVEINNPIFESNNRFLTVAEDKGQKLYFISGQDIAWQTQIEGNISRIHINKNGYVAVVIIDTSYKTVVNFYSPQGKELFKTFLKSTRVIDVSISNDNKYLALAEIDTSGTTIQSNIKIISIDKAQNDSQNSIIFIHNADPNKLITNIKYQDKDRLVCMYTDSIDVIENNQNRNIQNIEEKRITFASIELNNSITTIEEQSSGIFSVNTVVKLKNVSNERENEYIVSDVTKEIYTNGDVIALNFGTEVHFINTNGWLIKKYISKQEITNIVISENIAAIIYRDKIEVINI